MFSVREKQIISEKIQKVLRDTNHPELPEGEISFEIHVHGEKAFSFADIKNNGCFNETNKPSVNPWNESQDNLREV